MKTAGDRRIRKEASFAIIEPQVFNDDRAVQINVSRSSQRDPMFLQIDPVLSWIELNLYHLM